VWCLFFFSLSFFFFFFLPLTFDARTPEAHHLPYFF